MTKIWEKKVYVIGEAGLKSANEETGFISWTKKHLIMVIGPDWQVDYEVCYCDLGVQRSALYQDNLTSTFQQAWLVAGNLGSLIAPCWKQRHRSSLAIIGKPKAIIMDKAIEHLGLARRSGRGQGQLFNRYSCRYWQWDSFWWRQVLPNRRSANLTSAPTHVVASLAVGFWCLKFKINQPIFFILSAQSFSPLASMGHYPMEFIGWRSKPNWFFGFSHHEEILMSWWTTWPIPFSMGVESASIPLPKWLTIWGRQVPVSFWWRSFSWSLYSFIQFMQDSRPWLPGPVPWSLLLDDGLPVVLAVMTGMVALINSFRSLFHQVLFAGDNTWLFDPRVDSVILALPEDYFMHLFGFLCLIRRSLCVFYLFSRKKWTNITDY